VDVDKRVFVIGLDGATFDLIKPWSEAGYLPALNKLMKDGISGPLTSTYPPLTGPAWSSFMTGRSPGYHGVFEFFYRKKESYSQVLHHRLDIRGKSLWRRLSDAGKKVGVMGVPLSYPPEEVDGFTITGLLTPPNTKDFTYPPEIYSKLEDELGEYMLRHDEKYRPSNPQSFLDEQYQILENNTQAALYLMKNEPWDFFMFHILGTDRISHEFWHNLDETHPMHDPEERERLGIVILDFYKAVDKALEQVLAELGDDTVVMIMSDHGFGPVKKFINLNYWLLRKGFLKLKRTPATWLRYLLFRLGFNYSSLGRLILRFGFGKQAKQLGRAKREDLQRKVFLSLDDVDWTRSRVYSMGNFGQLYINLNGREPKGVVEPGEEYETLLKELISELENFKDPETGDAVVESIIRRDEVYEGPFIEKAPDLMFFTTNMEYKVMGLSDFSSPKVFEPIFGTTGHHRMDGVLICHGPEIFKEGVWGVKAGIHDLAPTIMYLMGQPVSKSMDGQIIFDLFKPDFVTQNPAVYAEEDDEDDTSDQKPLSRKEEQLVKDRLSELGYVT
jgi:predicted AlkP superfamily phosphohydrolase/phosphomutase